MNYIYDGSFEGLLSVVFDIYHTKHGPAQILTEDQQCAGLFEKSMRVNTDELKATRVFKGLKKKISKEAIKNLYKVHLSEKEEAAMLIYTYIRHVFDNKKNIEEDFSNETVLKVKQIVKMVHREVHRMHAFVRFKLTRDGIYAATVNPDFNVMPLIGSHFHKRYRDQKWMIYDVKRSYGLYYDLKRMEFISVDGLQLDDAQQFKEHILAEDELQFQELWKTYFKSTNIKERKNMKLHVQHMPKRYWKYLVEKA